MGIINSAAWTSHINLNTDGVFADGHAFLEVLINVNYNFFNDPAFSEM